MLLPGNIERCQIGSTGTADSRFYLMQLDNEFLSYMVLKLNECRVLLMYCRHSLLTAFYLYKHFIVIGGERYGM